MGLGPAWSSSTGKVAILYTGEPYPGVTPYVFMKSEPLLQATPVVASQDYLNYIFSLDEIRRSVRLYMPRTLESLLRSYDVIIISDSNVVSFTANHLLWFKVAVEEGGLGLVMVGGHETFGTLGSHPDWGQTPVGDVLPVETLPGKIGTGKVTILEKDHVFIRSLPWRPDLPFLAWYSCNIVEPKDGSHTLASNKIRAGDYQGWENPFFSTWDPGQGRTFAFTGDWQYGWGAAFIRWEYAPDFATNLMLYLAKRRIPEDLDLVHTLRSRMATLTYRRSMLDSLIEFVEKFGANPRNIIQAAERADEARGKVSELYMEESFHEALQLASDAISLMDDAEDVARAAKNNALMWIYVSEWLATTATSLLCGFTIWTLMIRRKLYREAGITRFT